MMLVDLGRNDIGRIAEPGTVKVDQFMKIEKFSHVMHLVSRVTGELDPSKTPFDAFRSVRSHVNKVLTRFTGLPCRHSFWSSESQSYAIDFRNRAEKAGSVCWSCWISFFFRIH